MRATWLVAAALAACSPAKTSKPLPKAPSAPRPAATAAPRQAPKSELEQRLAELADERTREEALARLEAMFEKALLDSEQDRSRDPAKRFIDASVARLTELYVENDATIRAGGRASLLKLLDRFEDPRSEPALRRAFEAFAAKPDDLRQLIDLKKLVRASARLRVPALDAPMLQAFLALRAGTQSSLLAQDLEVALFATRSAAWADSLIPLLGAELPDGPTGDELGSEAYQDQLFWQSTAARVLGQIGDPRAVDPLFAVLLAPKKLALKRDALLGLVSLGAPARTTAVRLLQRGGEAARTASEVLGMSGHPDALPPLLAALRIEKDPTARAFFALALTKLPATPEAIAAFQKAYESLPPKTLLEPGVPAHESLASAASLFFDSRLVGWLLARADAAPKGARQKALRSALLQSALLLARSQELPSVKAALDRYGEEKERTIHDQVAPLLSRCGEDTRCYLAELDESVAPGPAECRGVKAAWMLGVAGDVASRDGIVERLRRSDHLEGLMASAFALDRLTALDSNSVAEKLEAVVTAGHWSRDTVRRVLSSPSAPLRDVIARLRGRAR